MVIFGYSPANQLKSLKQPSINHPFPFDIAQKSTFQQRDFSLYKNNLTKIDFLKCAVTPTLGPTNFKGGIFTANRISNKKK